MSEDDGRKQVLRHQGLGWGDWGKGLKERECDQVPDFLRSRYLEMPGGGSPRNMPAHCFGAERTKVRGKPCK